MINHKYIYTFIIIIIIILFFYFFFNKNNQNQIRIDHFKNYPKIKIDLVYTWLDDSDPEWINTKNNYSEKILNIPGRSKSNIRFKNNEEMRYSLRSIYKYAPWINNIYIIVYDGHIPKWLNLNHPKIHLIWHSKIFPNPNDLPSFNSQAIECHIDNIPHLSEYFLYFNDDMFLGNDLHISDLLDKDLKPFFLIDKKASKPDFFLNKPTTGHNYAWHNVNLLLKNRLGIENKKEGVYTMHQGRLYQKSVMKKIKKLFHHEFVKTSKSKFRSKNDISPLGLISMVSLYSKYMNQKYCNSTYFKSLRKVKSKKELNEITNKIKKKKPKFICLNNFIPKKNLNLTSILKKLYPEKSPYEI